MWKKDERNVEQPETATRPHVAQESTPTGVPAVIGPTISIKGELTGEEDIIIEGKIEGKLDLRQHRITVGKSGVVRGEMRARVISIEGDVQGTLTGIEQLILSKSSTVRGDIIAPRVTLEDGAKFKGSIDMEPREVPREVIREAAMDTLAQRPSHPPASEARPASVTGAEHGKGSATVVPRSEPGAKVNPRM